MCALKGCLENCVEFQNALLWVFYIWMNFSRGRIFVTSPISRKWKKASDWSARLNQRLGNRCWGCHRILNEYFCVESRFCCNFGAHTVLKMNWGSFCKAMQEWTHGSFLINYYNSFGCCFSWNAFLCNLSSNDSVWSMIRFNTFLNIFFKQL